MEQVVAVVVVMAWIVFVDVPRHHQCRCNNQDEEESLDVVEVHVDDGLLPYRHDWMDHGEDHDNDEKENEMGCRQLRDSASFDEVKCLRL